MTGENLETKGMVNLGCFRQGSSIVLPWRHHSFSSGHRTCALCTVSCRTRRRCLKHPAQLPGHSASRTATFSLYIQVLCWQKQWFNYKKGRLLIVPPFLSLCQTGASLDWIVLDHLFRIWLAGQLIFENVKWIPTLSLDRIKSSEMALNELLSFVLYLCEVGLSILMIRKSEYQSAMKSAEGASLPTASNDQPRFKRHFMQE